MNVAQQINNKRNNQALVIVKYRASNDPELQGVDIPL